LDPCIFEYSNDDYFPDIISSCLAGDPQLVLPTIERAISKINTTIERLPIVKNEIIERSNRAELESFHRSWAEERIRTQPAKYYHSLEQELGSYRDRLNSLKEHIESYLDMSSEQIPNDKLQFKLSVQELCALVVLFLESGLISIDIEKTKLADTILAHFSTKNGILKSKDNLQNHLSPSEASLIKVEKHLYEMLKKCHDLKRKAKK
jgi:hypothetical protein